MDKKSFLDQLRERLSFLPASELERTLAYYSEIISDRMDNGMSEQEAVAAVGSIDEIVESVSTEGNYPETNGTEKKLSTPAKVMLYIGLVASYLVLIWDIILSVIFVIGAAACLVTSVITGLSLVLPAFLIFIGIMLILIALFLMTIPVASYLRYGICSMRKCLRR